MIFPTSSYLYRIWHDIYKRIFFTRVHAELKVVTFNWSNHPAAMWKQCAVYAIHISSPFLIRPFLFYRRVMFTHHSAHTKYISMGQQQKKVWVWGFNPGYTQREKNAERNKMRAVLFFLPIGIQTFIVKYIRAVPFQNFPLSPSLPNRQSLWHTQSLCSVREGGGRTWQENWPFAQTASTVTLRPVFHSSFIALPWRTAPRVGVGRITNFRLRNGHDIYRLVIYLCI